MAYYMGLNYSPQQDTSNGVGTAFIPNAQTASAQGAGPSTAATQPSSSNNRGLVSQNITDLPTNVFNNIQSNMPGGGAGGFGNSTPLENAALGRYNMFERNAGQGATPYALNNGIQANDPRFNPFMPSALQNTQQQSFQRDGLATPGMLDYNSLRFTNMPNYKDLLYGNSTGVQPRDSAARGMGTSILDQYHIPILQPGAEGWTNNGPGQNYGRYFQDDFVNNILADARSGKYGEAANYNNLPDMGTLRSDLIQGTLPTLGAYTPGVNGGYSNTGNFWDWWGAAAPYVGNDKFSYYQDLAKKNTPGSPGYINNRNL